MKTTCTAILILSLVLMLAGLLALPFAGLGAAGLLLEVVYGTVFGWFAVPSVCEMVTKIWTR